MAWMHYELDRRKAKISTGYMETGVFQVPLRLVYNVYYTALHTASRLPTHAKAQGEKVNLCCNLPSNS